MNFTAKTTSVTTQRTGCAVVAVFEPRTLSEAASAIDRDSGGAISAALRRGDLKASVGSTIALYGVDGITAERVVVVGLGKRKTLDGRSYRKGISAACEAVAKTGARDAVFYLVGLDVSGHDIYWQCRQLIEFTRDRAYQFNQFKSNASNTPSRLRRVTIDASDKEAVSVARTAIDHAVAVSDGIDLAKDLGNMPGNACTPTFLAERAKELGKTHPSVKVKVLSEGDMKKLGMGSLLSVSAGSKQPAKLIIMEYFGGPKDAAPVALVGKGVTFDTGGISIKPAGAMDEMKFDMCGAASVFGAMLAVAEMELETNVVGIVPATENMPGGNATKPGDIVTSMAGTTIEVLNTDAEGRLILCDALTYAGHYEPAAVIDIATLTGACVIALGSHATGLFCNNGELAADLLSAGQYTGDRAWEMPIWEEYQDQLKSNFADVANVGGRDAGAVTAACFLARFAKDYAWAHLDIAGAAWHSGTRKGSTGRPVKLLTQYILDRL